MSWLEVGTLVCLGLCMLGLEICFYGLFSTPFDDWDKFGLKGKVFSVGWCSFILAMWILVHLVFLEMFGVI